jgi:hypothetical protein
MKTSSCMKEHDHQGRVVLDPVEEGTTGKKLPRYSRCNAKTSATFREESQDPQS